MNPRLEAEKAALQQRAELERLALTAAWYDARAAVLPRSGMGGGRARPWVARTLAYAIPLFGPARVGRALRFASIGMGVYRLVRGLRK